MKTHILKGTGNNCTCYDCSVLYGGDCYTTQTNDFLDTLEKQVVEFLTYTPTGRKRKISDSIMDRTIEWVIKVPFCGFAVVGKKQFYENYYSFLPLLYLMTSDKKGAKYNYKKARYMLFRDITNKFKANEKASQ